MQLRFGGRTMTNSSLDYTPLVWKSSSLLRTVLIIEEQRSAAEYIYSLLTHDALRNYRRDFVELNTLAVVFMLSAVGLDALLDDAWSARGATGDSVLRVKGDLISLRSLMRAMMCYLLRLEALLLQIVNGHADGNASMPTAALSLMNAATSPLRTPDWTPPSIEFHENSRFDQQQLGASTAAAIAGQPRFRTSWTGPLFFHLVVSSYDGLLAGWEFSPISEAQSAVEFLVALEEVDVAQRGGLPLNGAHLESILSAHLVLEEQDGGGSESGM